MFVTTNQNAVAREVRPRHAAFAVEDIVEAVRHVRVAGAELLRIPANYCDDLAARYEFSDGELETYRELGILCDRHEQGGEFRGSATATRIRSGTSSSRSSNGPAVTADTAPPTPS